MSQHSMYHETTIIFLFLWLSFEPLINFMDMYVCIMMHDDILNNLNLGLHEEFKNYMTTKVMVNGKIISARIFLKG
jgi:hypothetical protein